MICSIYGRSSSGLEKMGFYIKKKERFLELKRIGGAAPRLNFARLLLGFKTFRGRLCTYLDIKRGISSEETKMTLKKCSPSRFFSSLVISFHLIKKKMTMLHTPSYGSSIEVERRLCSCQNEKQ